MAEEVLVKTPQAGGSIIKQNKDIAEISIAKTATKIHAPQVDTMEVLVKIHQAGGSVINQAKDTAKHPSSRQRKVKLERPVVKTPTSRGRHSQPGKGYPQAPLPEAEAEDAGQEPPGRGQHHQAKTKEIVVQTPQVGCGFTSQAREIAAQKVEIKKALLKTPKTGDSIIRSISKSNLSLLSSRSNFGLLGNRSNFRPKQKTSKQPTAQPGEERGEKMEVETELEGEAPPQKKVETLHLKPHYMSGSIKRMTEKCAGKQTPPGCGDGAGENKRALPTRRQVAGEPPRTQTRAGLDVAPGHTTDTPPEPPTQVSSHRCPAPSQPCGGHS